MPCSGKGYSSGFFTYCTTKLYGLMFARELATRLNKPDPYPGSLMFISGDSAAVICITLNCVFIGIGTPVRSVHTLTHHMCGLAALAAINE